MTAQDAMTERAKYSCLLQLSREQLKAIEHADTPAFERILVAKDALIRSLGDANALIETDPSVRALIEAIKLSEADAQTALQAKLEAIKGELNGMQQQASARNAYGRFDGFSKHGYDLRKDKTLPRFIDNAY
ncbi:MAG TPA: hypothetical protein VGK19_23785 [Capsulimonadaceae bacterium]|jgi:hypothetical protein